MRRKTYTPKKIRFKKPKVYKGRLLKSGIRQHYNPTFKTWSPKAIKKLNP